MARFASPATQAERLSRSLHRDGHVASIRTANAYAGALKGYAEWLGERRVRLEQSTHTFAREYLEGRSEQVGQSALNLDRQAIDKYHSIYATEQPSLPVLKSEEKTALTSRRYTPEQVALVQRCQNPEMAFATELAFATGIRAHELYTLQRGDHSSDRDWEPYRWAGRLNGYAYSVTGKGGLVRMIRIPYDLADRLETMKLATPRTVTDRGVHYQQRYDLKGGSAVSKSFSKASQRALGWSRGFHGLRHSFAQQRYAELLQRTQKPAVALLGTSHCLGHLRPDITLVYLR